MGRKARPFRATPTMRRDMCLIRRYLAERGYSIVRPIKRYQRRNCDFVAVRIDGHGLAVESYRVILFMAARERILYRPYTPRVLVKSDITLVRKKIKSNLRTRTPLPTMPNNDWRLIVHPADRALL